MRADTIRKQIFTVLSAHRRLIISCIVTISFLYYEMHILNTISVVLSFAGILLGAAAYLLSGKYRFSDEADKLIPVFCLFFGISTAVGILYRHDFCLEKLYAAEWIFGVGLIGYSISAAAFIFLQWGKQLLAGLSAHNRTFPSGDITFLRRLAVIAAHFAVIFICWLPMLLAYYPGLFNYDSRAQLISYLDNSVSKFHPLIHSALLIGCYKIGMRYLGGMNSALLLYCILQMIIMAFCLAYACEYIWHKFANKPLSVITLLFFSVIPIHSVLAISPTKDVIFSGMALVSFVTFLKLEEITDKKSPRAVLLYFIAIISTAAALLFRNNAVYAYALLIIFFVIRMILTMIRKNSAGLKQVLSAGAVRFFLILIVSLFLMKAGNAVLERRYDAREGDLNEMLSVPSNQIARMYSEGYLYTDEEQELLAVNFPKENYERWEYTPHNADVAKLKLDGIETVDDLLDFCQIWFQICLRHPMSAVDAFLLQTEGYWDICDTSCDTAYTADPLEGKGYLQTFVYDGFDVEPSSKIPALKALIEWLFSYNNYKNIPVLAVIFQMAVYLWFLFLFRIKCRQFHQMNLLLFTDFFACYMMTQFLGPIALVRYMYLLMPAAPVLLGLFTGFTDTDVLSDQSNT